MISSFYGKIFGYKEPGQNCYILNPVPIKVGVPGPQISSTDQIAQPEDVIKIYDSD